MYWFGVRCHIVYDMNNIILFRARLVSSENFHWTWQDLDMCPRVDTCPRSNVSSENFHWTQAGPFYSYKRNFMVTSNIRVREIVTKFSKLDIT